MKNNSFREAPRPNYEYDVDILTKEYTRALKSVQRELDSLFLSDFERVQIVAVEKNIKQVLADVDAFGADWAKHSIDKAARQGVASVIYSLDLDLTMEDAIKIAKFNRVNKPLVEAMIADTQADLLAMTQNVSRKTRAAVRRSSADVMRGKMASGINGVQSLTDAMTKELRRTLGGAADSAIVDAAGRRWKLRSYTEMLARTKMMEAHREATTNEALGRGVQYGIVNRYGATDNCRLYEGRVLKLVPDAAGDYMYIGDIPRYDIFHPNCGHSITSIRNPERLPDDLKELNGL